jgi:hypothetical protein
MGRIAFGSADVLIFGSSAYDCALAAVRTNFPIIAVAVSLVAFPFQSIGANSHVLGITGGGRCPP